MSSATDLLAQIATFSRRVLGALQLPSAGSPWGVPKLSPQGLICHYTADPDMLRVLRWFCNAKQNARVSAHFVVGDQDVAAWRPLTYGLPLVAALPVPIVQCRAIGAGAWHATVANATHLGAELVNAGELRADGQGGYVWWCPRDRSAPEWTSPYAGQAVAACGRLWAPFPDAQLRAFLALATALHQVAPLDPARMVGHEAVQGLHTTGGLGTDKRDAGPLFPLGPLRAAVRARQDPAAAPLPPDWLEALADRSLAALGAAPGGTAALWPLLAQDLPTSAPQTPDYGLLLPRAALAQLGFDVAAQSAGPLSASEVWAVRTFQRLVGLAVDGTLGPETCAALTARLCDRTGTPPAAYAQA